MPNTLHYEGSFYFGSNAEMEEVGRLLKQQISYGPDLNTDKSEKELKIDISVPFGKKEELQSLLHNAATYALHGMLLVYMDDVFTDIIYADRTDTFNPDRPGLILFTLQEFEETFGKLDMDISKMVYDSPFYIYDESLDESGPEFIDEDPIGDEDCNIGFAALKAIWVNYVAQSDTFAFPTLFKLMEGSTEGMCSVRSTYGFAPGYTFEEAAEEARKKNFLVFRWSDFWDNRYVINE
ncbi:hypothetical protein [uncultured Flavobacterium sp.]|uniref:hypothetical protein n=1 Tax=uncultured Flavobacterium sp. TaxID=165435 RepID=UPI0025FEC222|nr:hypothetical protein [uncultured Flavobacterium sp.]